MEDDEKDLDYEVVKNNPFLKVLEKYGALKSSEFLGVTITRPITAEELIEGVKLLAVPGQHKIKPKE